MYKSWQVSTTTYKNQKYLVQRTYDSFDKPDYYYFISLDENEYQLNDGRFKNFDDSYQDYYGSDFGYMVLTKNQILDILNWIRDNCVGKWKFGIEYHFKDEFNINFYFHEKADKLAFKLVWI